ncbi:uncharacterized protein LOC133528442 [Cydia pomonella]|uniref:uncharacterized protein LOC133528442 n=1 Tax=Cydia pomonella TaxID=82600 RepID=UPI002ADDC5AB|nr:uncharacterized protein LOC133528442 [Cydia pomonella]
MHPTLSVDMLLVLLLLAHTRAEWVEITQLHKPTHHREVQDVLDFHEQRRRPSFSKEPSLGDGKRKHISSTEHSLYDKKESQFSTEPALYKEKRRPYFPTEPTDFDDNKRLPQFSTEPGFLADYKRNRIYINHSIDQGSHFSVDQSPEKHWTKGVVHRVPNPTVGTVKRVYLTTEEPAKVKYEETDLTHELKGYTIRNPFKDFEDQKPEFVTKEETFEDDGNDEIHFVSKSPTNIWAKGNEIQSKNPTNGPVRRVDAEENGSLNKIPSNISEEDQNGEPGTSGTKPNTMENVLKFTRVVADTITRNTRKSVSSKLRYLEDLKDTIMVNIEDRIEYLWPDDTGGSAARRRRWSRSAEARGHHVEFPSSESALMTISFLTFAVYLIKLVLQVIQTYKNKTMMVTPAVFAAVGRSARSKQKDSQ